MAKNLLLIFSIITIFSSQLVFSAQISRSVHLEAHLSNPLSLDFTTSSQNARLLSVLYVDKSVALNPFSTNSGPVGVGTDASTEDSTVNTV